MKVQAIQNQDIDTLKELQPAGWDDIRPYFYFYSSSVFCDPIKISEAGKIAAIGTTIKYKDSAWLAHVIVHPDFRNQGLGKLLTSTLVENLDPKLYQTIYLDATDMGYPVYKKLGFELETEYIHLEGEYTDHYLKDPASVVPYDKKYRTELLELDKNIYSENREILLNEHLNTSLLYVAEGRVRGAYFPHCFEKFILADDPDAGTELMKLRMRVKNTAKFPVDNQTAINFLFLNKYRLVKTSRRMRLGKKREWKPENIFNRITGGMG